MKDKAAGLTSASTPTVLLRSLGRPSNSRCSHPFDASGTLSGLGRGETLPPPRPEIRAAASLCPAAPSHPLLAGVGRVLGSGGKAKIGENKKKMGTGWREPRNQPQICPSTTLLSGRLSSCSPGQPLSRDPGASEAAGALPEPPLPVMFSSRGRETPTSQIFTASKSPFTTTFEDLMSPCSSFLSL